MASRNPNIQIPRLVTEPSALRSHSAASHSNSQSSNSNFVRKPRFHEDFDAPFLLDLLDASPTSPYGNSSSHSTSPSSSRPSLDDATARKPLSSGGSPSRSGPPPPITPSLPKRIVTSPIFQLQQGEWSSSEPRRRVSVHDKMRKLARRSLVMVRQRPGRSEDDVAAAAQSRPASSIADMTESSEHLETVDSVPERPRRT